MIEMEMPVANKRDIKPDIRGDSLCLSAPRGDEAQYSTRFMLFDEVDPGKAEVKYENGLSRIISPIKGWGGRQSERPGSQ